MLVADGDRRLVVTCRHVVGDAREVLVYFPRFEEGRPVVEAARYLREHSAAVGRVIAADPRATWPWCSLRHCRPA